MMPDKRACMCVAFDAMAFHQDYAVKGRFAEVVPAIGGDCDTVPSRERACSDGIRRPGRAGVSSGVGNV
ncbi:hypothetical protein [Bradyrhizobium sp. BWC-3-1]|uniref:hypothetical protein n=1 Tax=Bradyrhizobium sp. BWC-3-1 TaxID=3080012 RepID=UPI00293E39B4|nr:hypothetical protein [Bradyrhizobium sp. BWC-3-1]WOH60168.1 hypothetical protein RX329_08665 [Bradyrhizobium sp. BWC-3-1]